MHFQKNVVRETQFVSNLLDAEVGDVGVELLGCHVSMYAHGKSIAISV